MAGKGENPQGLPPGMIGRKKAGTGLVKFFGFYIKESARKKEGREEAEPVRRNRRELLFAAGERR